MTTVALKPQDAAGKLIQRRAIRRSLAEWARYRGFEPAAHHLLIIREIEEFLAGDEEVLLLFAPPGSAKSTFVSVLFPSWYLARYPKNSILFATHSVEFAERWGRRVRNDIATDGPTLGISLSEDNKAAARWSISAGGEYYGVGAGTGISGFRADLGLGDDFFGSREDAWSEAVRKKRWEWYIDDFSARLKPGAKRILMNCMTGDTAVTMADGSWRPLADVRPGDEVVAWEDGKPVNRRILNWTPQGEDDVLEIRTGSSRVKANARHPFLVVDKKGQPKWTRAGDLERGDQLATLSMLEQSGNRLTARAAWLLGYMFGDGWVTVRDTVQKGRGQYTARDGTVRRYAEAIYPRRGYVTCVAHAIHPEENQQVSDAFSDVVGVRPKPTPYGYSRTDVAAVGRWFRDFGLTGGAKSKRLPAWIFSECEENRLAFLAGYNAADGHIHPSGPNKGRWTQHSVSRKLIEDVRHLARGVGYPVTNISTRINSGQPPHSPAPIVSEISNVQWGAERKISAFIDKQITGIRPAGREMVYDIEVEGAGCFIADGVVSHNTRWHEEDVAGHVLQQIESGQVRGRVISIAAEAEEGDILRRPVGTMLWDDDPNYRYGDFLRSRKGESTAMMWAALYQQRPAPEEGDYFKAEWLVSCETPPDRATLRVYGGSDYAVTADGGDYTVHVVVGLDPDGRMYLLDVWRKQTSSEEWIEAFCDLVKQWKPMAWAEEQGQIRAGVGPFLDRRQRERGAYVYRETFPTRGDKGVRAQSIRGRMALEKLYVPEHASWYAACRSELLGFPAGKHDDFVDALGLVGQLLDVMLSGTAAKKASNVVSIGYKRLERKIEGFKTY